MKEMVQTLFPFHTERIALNQQKEESQEKYQTRTRVKRFTFLPSHSNVLKNLNSDHFSSFSINHSV